MLTLQSSPSHEHRRFEVAAGFCFFWQRPKVAEGRRACPWAWAALRVLLSGGPIAGLGRGAVTLRERGVCGGGKAGPLGLLR